MARPLRVEYEGAFGRNQGNQGNQGVRELDFYSKQSGSLEHGVTKDGYQDNGDDGQGVFI